MLYQGLEVLGSGAILAGMVLGAIGAFIVDKKFVEASAFAAAGAVLTFFGFMHGEAVGIAVTPTVAVAYALVAAFLYGLSRMPAEATAPQPMPKGGDASGGREMRGRADYWPRRHFQRRHARA